MTALAKLLVKAMALVSLSHVAPPLQAGQSSLINFALEDHSKAVHTPGEWKNRWVILFLADREGSEFNRGYVWTTPLVAHIRSLAPANTQFVSIADLRSAPAPARGFLRSRFKPDAQDPIGMTLLDWQGQLFMTYAVAPAAFHMLVFDNEHTLVYQKAVRAFDAGQLIAIKEAFNSNGAFR